MENDEDQLERKEIERGKVLNMIDKWSERWKTKFFGHITRRDTR